MTDIPATPLSAAEVRERILAGGELALIDVRETGTYGERHLLHARSLPLSWLEMRVADLLPRPSVPIVLMSGGADDAGLVARAAAKLVELGYTDLASLEGGVDAWEAAGFEVFSGVLVPSKAFGEFVEHTYDTPRINAEDLHALMQSGEKLVVLDSRPWSEYHTMNIPTGIDVPGAELALRVHDLAPDPDTTVVVNCAGRTRSIIGCQSLINAGIPNRVMALENGTMGWHLAGLELERGADRRFGSPTERGLAKAREVAGRVSQRFGVRRCTWDEVDRWRGELDRTTYLFDVRDPDDFLRGRPAGFRNAPGGQLVQATDTYVGAMGARIVLMDDLDVRAVMTASWLVQMGWDDVYVLDEPFAGREIETGHRWPPALGLDACPEADLPPADLKKMIESGAPPLVLDVDSSLQHRRGHVPGARFAIRANLARHLDLIRAADAVVLVSLHERLARFAARDLAGHDVTAQVLAGGTEAWRAAGFAVEEGFEGALDDAVDLWYKPYDLDDDDQGAMKQYLSWEVDLVKQIARDGTTRFREFPG